MIQYSHYGTKTGHNSGMILQNLLLPQHVIFLLFNYNADIAYGLVQSIIYNWNAQL